MNYRVIISTPEWKLNGVNVHAANLVRGLRAAGIEAGILLTNPGTQSHLAGMDMPSDIPFETLGVKPQANWPARWRAMIAHLESRKPCVLLPNFDWEHSCVAPRLSREVGIAGIIHSDDPLRWYQHVARVAPFWDAFVAVSNKIANELRGLAPEIEDRLRVIRYGVEIPAMPPIRPAAGGRPLRLVYAGRLAQEQKRVLDLPRIMELLEQRGVAAELAIIGGGPDAELLAAACRELVARGVVSMPGILTNEETVAAFELADVLLLTSEYEGLPVTLLEAMGRGCVPVVTDIPSGVPEVVADGRNGFLLPVGDLDGFAGRLAALQAQPKLLGELSHNAHATVDRGGFRIADMTHRYIEVFDQVMDAARSGAFRRPRGEIVPPPSLTRRRGSGWRKRIPGWLRTASRVARGLRAGHNQPNSPE